jgi:hypothetical protein
VKILTRVSLVGWIVLICSAFPYPLVDSQRVFWSIFLPTFAAAAIFLRGASGKTVTPTYFLAALVPWMLAGLFFANGALDHSAELHYPTVVVETRYSYRSGIRDTLVVRSWRPGRTTESVTVNAYQRFFYPGERVTVRVRTGALGLSWISGVSR